jgi:hypothetical protein
LPIGLSANAAFRAACEGGNIDVLRATLSIGGAHAVDVHSADGVSFATACRRGHSAVVRELLALTGERAMGRNALQWGFQGACDQQFCHIAHELLQVTGDRAIDVHAEDNEVLCEACRKGHLDVVRTLLAAKGTQAADVHTNAPLMHALYEEADELTMTCPLTCSRLAVVGMLLSAGAAPTAHFTRAIYPAGILNELKAYREGILRGAAGDYRCTAASRMMGRALEVVAAWHGRPCETVLECCLECLGLPAAYIASCCEGELAKAMYGVIDACARQTKDVQAGRWRAVAMLVPTAMWAVHLRGAPLTGSVHEWGGGWGHAVHACVRGLLWHGGRAAPTGACTDEGVMARVARGRILLHRQAAEQKQA